MLPTVDVIVAGEVQEWESATYAQDVVVRRRQEGLHLDRPRRQRSAGHAGLRRLAEDDRSRSADPVRLGRRSLLEAALMAALTAGDVVNRIKAVMAVQGVPWNDATTRDRFKFGGPDTVVTGIATTFMGTFEAITQGRRARPQPDHPARGHLLERSRTTR